MSLYSGALFDRDFVFWLQVLVPFLTVTFYFGNRYSYSTPVGELTPTVEIQWNNNFVLETNSSISVTRKLKSSVL